VPQVVPVVQVQPVELLFFVGKELE
jgi:hypothetical protein